MPGEYLARDPGTASVDARMPQGHPAGMEIATIGYEKASQAEVIATLRRAGVKRLIDVRLNNVSQLAGFTKKEDLRFFLRAIAGIEYLHLTELAPTPEMLDEYKKKKGAWEDYEKRFLDLIAQRRIEESLPRDVFASGCLLCSEAKPHHCHRRLVAEYLKQKWGDVEVRHL